MLDCLAAASKNMKAVKTAVLLTDRTEMRLILSSCNVK